MKQILLLSVMSILTIGCGSGGASTLNEPEEDTNDVNMTKGISYNVFSNNKLIKNSTNALVKISHKDNTSYSSVILLSGSATIIRKP